LIGQNHREPIGTQINSIKKEVLPADIILVDMSWEFFCQQGQLQLSEHPMYLPPTIWVEIAASLWHDFTGANYGCPQKRVQVVTVVVIFSNVELRDYSSLLLVMFGPGSKDPGFEVSLHVHQCSLTGSPKAEWCVDCL
jgi:hypothetical protein